MENTYIFSQSGAENPRRIARPTVRRRDRPADEGELDCPPRHRPPFWTVKRPAPQTAILDGHAPRAPMQTRHTKPIYCGKREGRLAAPGGPGPTTRAAYAAAERNHTPKSSAVQPVAT